MNERLRQALREKGLEIDELAATVQVDVKTARRWLAGRTPRARYRHRVADTLGVPEQLLWPGELPGHEPAGNGTEEVTGESVEVFTGGDVPDWRELAAGARERVCLLDLTLADVITDQSDVSVLTDAAGRGCRVRVLVSDPDSVHLAIAEQDAGRHVNLTRRPVSAGELDRVVGLLSPGSRHGALEVRKFVDAGVYRVLVFADQALIRLRLSGVDTDALPVLHLTGAGAGDMFAGFTEHFEAVWQRSEPLG